MPDRKTNNINAGTVTFRQRDLHDQDITFCPVCFRPYSFIPGFETDTCNDAVCISKYELILEGPQRNEER